jgi:hypothetical protein
VKIHLCELAEMLATILLGQKVDSSLCSTCDMITAPLGGVQVKGEGPSEKVSLSTPIPSVSNRTPLFVSHRSIQVNYELLTHYKALPYHITYLM